METSDGANAPDSASFLQCMGIGVATGPSGGDGFGNGSYVSVGPLVASTENGAPKCCHVATTTYNGYNCGRPLVRPSGIVVAELVFAASPGWA